MSKADQGRSAAALNSPWRAVVGADGVLNTPGTAATCPLPRHCPFSSRLADVFLTLVLLLLVEDLLGPLNRHSPGLSLLYTWLVAGIYYCRRPSLRAHRKGGEVACICAHSCKDQL